MRKLLMLLPALMMLAGCFNTEEDNLREWMAQERQKVRPAVKPIPPPKPYKPENYTQDGKTEPFAFEKLGLAMKRDKEAAAKVNKLIQAELARRKEALESYPLDTMTMVGSLIREDKTVALIKVDKMLHQVRVNNYLGQNYGKIIRITETEVVLREVVQDATGDWVERPMTLELQEIKK